LKRNRAAFYRITGPIVGSLLINQFVFFGAGEPPCTPASRNRDKTVLKTLRFQPPQKRKSGVSPPATANKTAI
jgi:hypothetical protein